MQLELVVLGHNPMVSKTYYGRLQGRRRRRADVLVRRRHHAGRWCAAAPVRVVRHLPRRTCGARRSARCRASRSRPAPTPSGSWWRRADGIDGEAYELSITPGALKDWAVYVKRPRQAAASRSRPCDADLLRSGGHVPEAASSSSAATSRPRSSPWSRSARSARTCSSSRRRAAPARSFPRARSRSSRLRSPLRHLPPRPLLRRGAPVTPPAPVAPVAPPPPPAPADPFAGLPPHVKSAVDAAGGLGSATGDATYKALAGKDAPTVAAQQVPPPPPPPDPFAGQAAHVAPAVLAAGGLGTPTGDATYKALTGKDAPGVAAAPAAAAPAGSKRKPRGTATAPTAPVTPAQTPAAPAAAAPVAPPAASMVAAPAAQVVAPGAAMDIEAMLAQALAQPVGQ
jgi:hypothetical protein